MAVDERLNAYGCIDALLHHGRDGVRAGLL